MTVKIEHIQRQAARFVLNNYHQRDSVSTMIQELQWTSLEKRRQAASLILMFRIHSHQIAINPDQYLTPMAPSRTRSYHPLKYQAIPSRIQVYKFSFFPRTTNWWNKLPGNILASPSTEAFKGAVAAHI
jgi:hypothetical protein